MSGGNGGKGALRGGDGAKQAVTDECQQEVGRGNDDRFVDTFGHDQPVGWDDQDEAENQRGSDPQKLGVGARIRRDGQVENEQESREEQDEVIGPVVGEDGGQETGEGEAFGPGLGPPAPEDQTARRQRKRP